jgi:hypothetical protein
LLRVTGGGAGVVDRQPREYTDSQGKKWIYNPHTGNYQRLDQSGYEAMIDPDTGEVVPGMGVFNGRPVRLPQAKDAPVLSPDKLLASYERELKALDSPLNWANTTPEERAEIREALQRKIDQVRSGGKAQPADNGRRPATPRGAGNYDFNFNPDTRTLSRPK